MSIEAARLQATVGADTKGFDRGMAHADSTIQKAPGKWATALKVGGGAALAVGAAFVVKGLVGAIRGGLDSLKEEGVVVAQTNAVIRSTGGAANVTAEQIRALSSAIEDKTTIDDKAVQSGANMLLTFTNVRNEIGAGNDIFNQATSILADMSTAMGTDMKGGAIQLGKALNDPLKGITALTRVGVTFDAQQKKRIERFMAEGKVAEAQKIILAELNKEFGGSGAAFAATDAGQAAAFDDAIEGVQQTFATGLLPAIRTVRGALKDFLTDPATMGQAKALGESIGAIFSKENLSTAASLMKTAAVAIGKAFELFGALPPEIQALAVGALALKKITGIGPGDIAKGIGGAIKFVFERGATPANPLFVADVTGGLGKGALPAVAAAGAGAAAGTGLALATAVIAPIAVAATAAIISDQINQQGAALVQQASEFALKATDAELANSIKGVTEQLNGMQFNTFDSKNKVIATLNTLIAEQNRRATGANNVTGGRGDASTAARVKEQSERSGVWERAIAAGFKPTAASVERTLILNRERNAAILEKNRQAIATADAREASRSETLRGAITSKGEQTAAAVRAGTSAFRAKQLIARVSNYLTVNPNRVTMTINQRVLGAALVTYQRSSGNSRYGPVVS